jgi:hypothetical protein
MHLCIYARPPTFASHLPTGRQAPGERAGESEKEESVHEDESPLF